MKMTGEERIPASREAVWAALNDPEVLKACIPGCQELEKRSETELAARVGIKMGPVKATFDGEVELSDLEPPVSYRIAGEGKGGVAGHAKGGANVRLSEVPAEGAPGTETLLAYDVDASVGGKIAQLGGRLIDSTARKLAGKFFANLREHFEKG